MPSDDKNRFGRSFGEGYSYVALGFAFAFAILAFGAVDGWWTAGSAPGRCSPSWALASVALAVHEHLLPRQEDTERGTGEIVLPAGGVGCRVGGGGGGDRGRARGGDRWRRGAGGAARRSGAAAARDARSQPLFMARWFGGMGYGRWRSAPCWRSRRRTAPPSSAARGARLPGVLLPLLFLERDSCDDAGADIGKVIFEHTSDSHVVELPFGLGEWHCRPLAPVRCGCVAHQHVCSW